LFLNMISAVIVGETRRCTGRRGERRRQASGKSASFLKSSVVGVADFLVQAGRDCTKGLFLWYQSVIARHTWICHHIVAQRPWPKALIFSPPATRMLTATKWNPQQVV